MFAEQLKSARKAGGYTQASLATALGVTKGTVAMWETDKRHPSYEKLAEISDLLRVSIDYLIKGTPVNAVLTVQSSTRRKGRCYFCYNQSLL